MLLLFPSSDVVDLNQNHLCSYRLNFHVNRGRLEPYGRIDQPAALAYCWPAPKFFLHLCRHTQMYVAAPRAILSFSVPTTQPWTTEARNITLGGESRGNILAHPSILPLCPTPIPPPFSA